MLDDGYGYTIPGNKYCEFFVDNRYKNLSSIEKELLKKAIDESQTIEEMLVTAFAAVEMNKYRKPLCTLTNKEKQY